VSRVEKTAAKNIDAVAELQRQVLEEGGAARRMAESIANFAGSMRFVVLHLIGFAVWIAINTGLLGIAPFDPYPFILLSLIVSCEAVLISTFVLIKQNHT